MIKLFNFFTKITGYIPQKTVFRTKIYYEDKRSQSRKLKGKTIICSNHTSVYDYAVFLFVFFGRTLRYQMAEVLYKKKILALFLNLMGGIKVDRYSNDYGFMNKSEKILSKKGVIGIFPESRIPEKNEVSPLPFKPSAVYLALTTNTPIVPVYTNGRYFTKDRAKVVIGTKFYPSDYYDNNLSEKENLQNISEVLRNKIIELSKICYEEK